MRSNEINNHHILYCRKKWSIGHAKLLRYHPYMQVEIPLKELHEQIHQNVPEVPVPSLERCKAAYDELVYLDDRLALKRDASIIERIDLLLFIWGGYSGMDDTFQALKRQKEIAQEFYLNHSESSHE